MNTGPLILNMPPRTSLLAHPSRLSQQTGITLLEVLVAVSLLGFMVVAANALVDDHLRRVRTTATAQQMQVFAKATQAYIKDNYAYLTTGGNGIVPATPTAPAVITLAMLKDTIHPESGQTSPTRYLPTGFQDKNGHQQTLCALVLQPKPNELYALVVTEGGEAINDVDLSLLAASMGAAGGGIYARNPSLARGTLGKWEFNLATDPVGQNFKNVPISCTGHPLSLTPGHPLMALWFAEDPAADFLHRNEVAGHPELNTLQTDLRFRDDFIDEFDKNNPQFFGGATAQLSVERVLNEECNLFPTVSSPINPQTGKKEVPLGTLARTDDGELLFCQEDLIKKKNYWARNVSAGRWEFELIRPVTPVWDSARNDWNVNPLVPPYFSPPLRRKFVATGYFVDKDHFSGTLHCDPRENKHYACGSAGHVDCRSESRSKAIDWNGGALLTSTNPLNPNIPWVLPAQKEVQVRRCAWFYASGQNCTINKDYPCYSDQYQVDVVNLKVENPIRRKW